MAAIRPAKATLAALVVTILLKPWRKGRPGGCSKWYVSYAWRLLDTRDGRSSLTALRRVADVDAVEPETGGCQCCPTGVVSSLTG